CLLDLLAPSLGIVGDTDLVVPAIAHEVHKSRPGRPRRSRGGLLLSSPEVAVHGVVVGLLDLATATPVVVREHPAHEGEGRLPVCNKPNIIHEEAAGVDVIPLPHQKPLLVLPLILIPHVVVSRWYALGHWVISCTEPKERETLPPDGGPRLGRWVDDGSVRV